MTTESRLDQVESELSRRDRAAARRLERRWSTRVVPSSIRRAPARAPPRRWPAAAGPEQPRASPRIDFERLFGGRVLAWIGGIAILLRRRPLHRHRDRAAAGSTRRRARSIGRLRLARLLSAGVWLHERKGRTEAAGAPSPPRSPASIATIVVATQAYDLIPPELGLVLGAAVAAVGFAIAVRWDSPVVAAVGLLGALAAPVLVGTASTALDRLRRDGPRRHRRRPRSGSAGTGSRSAPSRSRRRSLVEISGISFEGDPDQRARRSALARAARLLVLYAVAASATSCARDAEEELPVASWLLLFGSCAPGRRSPATRCSHTAATRPPRSPGSSASPPSTSCSGASRSASAIHREIGSLLIGLGIALTAFGLADAFDGPALVVAWAAAAAALASFDARRRDPRPALSNAERLLIAAGCFLALAIGHTLVVEAPPSRSSTASTTSATPGRDRRLRRAALASAASPARSSRRARRSAASSAPPRSSTSARSRSSTRSASTPAAKSQSGRPGSRLSGP